MTTTTRLAAVLSGLLMFAAASAASAAPAPIDRSPAKVADAVQAQPAAVSEDDETATCSRARKRLWVEGEGWIVRRVTICR